MPEAIIILIMLFYSIMIIAFAISWLFRRNSSIKPIYSYPDLSIIIAFRNEERTLNDLINSLIIQNYKGNYEIIFINDHSNDNSVNIINSFGNEKIKLLNLPEGLYGKKQALRYAQNFVSGKILFFTDADCIVFENWLSSMTDSMICNDTKMLCGPVQFITGKSLFSKLVSLEFLSMTGSGASGFFLKKPFMCNGANYAITREIFNEASAFFNDKYSSGDDVFLLHYVSGKYKADFIKNRDSIVNTVGPDSIKKFLSQRVRWASKTTGYRNFMSIITVLLTFLASLSIIVTLIMTIINIDYLKLFLFSYLGKILIDTFFMIPVLRFYKKMRLIFYMPLLQIFYPFYIVATGLLSFIWHPNWKGRKIS